MAIFALAERLPISATLVVTTIKRRGEYRGIFGEEGVNTGAYLGGNHGFRV